ncbi:acyltransferase [Flavobacterium panacagri]|uniref:acyltransferase n=1 Tax=Flavobacterium panacagri TaxID=3034146 RepID=UPI0025A4E194|nr:acyltransferase [Flavobacterium panacagri]
MPFTYFFQQSLFVLQVRYFNKIGSLFRKIGLRFQGMKIGSGVDIPKIYTIWPHQVSLGKNCILERGIYFKYAGIWSKGPSIIIEEEVFIGAGCEFNINCGIQISKYSNIASGCKFIDHDHGTEAGKLIGPQPSIKAEIFLGQDVWLGCNVVVLKGVQIGEGSIIAAGAVVTKSIPANQIWGGVPAKFIKNRI